MGVDTGGAGDQGLMFGYACDETEELMPFPIMMAHKLCLRLAEARRQGILDFLRPDGKSQVTVEYEGAKPVRVEAVVVSTQHSDKVAIETVREGVMECVIKPVIPAHMLDQNTKYHINPTGRFVTGGPVGDSGLTGRKIIVDTYGGMAHHGGGCFLRQGPHQGGPFRHLHGPLHCEEHRCGRTCEPRGGPTGLRHRSRGTGFRNGGYLRDRQSR